MAEFNSIESVVDELIDKYQISKLRIAKIFGSYLLREFSRLIAEKINIDDIEYDLNTDFYIYLSDFEIWASLYRLPFLETRWVITQTGEALRHLCDLWEMLKNPNQAAEGIRFLRFLLVSFDLAFELPIAIIRNDKELIYTLILQAVERRKGLDRDREINKIIIDEGDIFIEKDD